MKFPTIGRASLILAALVLAACGGGASTSSNPPPVQEASCSPADPATFDQCGVVLIGLTDAEGDFLNYSVDVLSLTLETANGRVVEVMPGQARINFTDYVDLTELVAAVHVPPAVYVAGSISIDYTGAEIFVEAGQGSKEAIVTDLAGTPLEQTELKIVLADRDRLAVTRGRAHFLQLDFDLEASHEVDTTPTPATAAIDQLIIAEVHPVDEKTMRVHGLLRQVNLDEMSYTISIRPWHDWDGDHGQFTVNVTDDTEFEVDGEVFGGADGLAALGNAGPGTPTVARGTLSLADRSFVADIVLAGSSVPGHHRDAVVGNIIKRDGNMLTVRGATIIPRLAAMNRRVHFHDAVVVEIGPNTKVRKDGHRAADLTIDALSIGQRVTVLGEQPLATTDAAAPQILFDATEGAVRMHVTKIAGVVNTVFEGQTDITLHSIDRRRVEIFDFTGTGMSPADDADPGNYEVETFNLALADFAAGKPIVVTGFPTAFGMAPPDFSGRSVIDYANVRSTLGVGWGAEGTAAAFTSVGEDGIVLNNLNPDIDQRRFIKQGVVLIDLTALDSPTTIVPRESGRKLFAIKTADSVRIYSDWDDFTDDLNASLGAGNLARSMYARGLYDVGTNTFTAYKLGVFLLEP